METEEMSGNVEHGNANVRRWMKKMGAVQRLLL